MSVDVWSFEITERGSPTVLASTSRGGAANDSEVLQVISAEGQDPLNDVGIGSLVVPLSSPKAAELVANRLLHIRLNGGDILTSYKLGAPSDVVRDPDVTRQTRTVPLKHISDVLNDSVVTPPNGWNVIPRGDDRHYDWSEPSGPSGGTTPISLGTVDDVNALPYPVVPYFTNSAQPDITEVITWSGNTGLSDDAPAGTIYSAQGVEIGGGFYYFLGAADNYIDTLRVSGSEIMRFQYGFINGWQSPTFEWSGGDMKIAAAWANDAPDGRGPISLAMELVNATTGEVVWWTSPDFKGFEFPSNPPGMSDGAIGRLNLAESQDSPLSALPDVITTFSDEADSNVVQWPEISVSTKSRTKLGAFHLNERSAWTESRLRFIDTGDDAGNIYWDLYQIGGRGGSVDVAIEVNVDIGTMSIDREEPAATAVAYATKDRFIVKATPVDDLPEGQPVIIGVDDLEAAGTLGEADVIAGDELADFNHQREKIAIEHTTYAGDYWTADSIPTVASDGDGDTTGARVQSMHWWINRSGSFDAEPEFGDLIVPVVARAANAQSRLAPRGVVGRSRRATRG